MSDANYDDTADKAATTDEEGGQTTNYLEEIQGFRCECGIISWMPIWELILDTMEYSCAIPCIMIPNCCAAGDEDEKCDGSLNRCCFCIPCIDLRLGIRIFGLLSMVTAIERFIAGVNLLSVQWFWGITYMGVAFVSFWLAYLLWVGSSKVDNDKLAISLNITGWLIITMTGIGIFQMITAPKGTYSFGTFLIQVLVVFGVGFTFIANHVTKLFRKIRKGGDDVDAWREDAETLAWHGCPFCRTGEESPGEVEVTGTDGPVVNQA